MDKLVFKYMHGDFNRISKTILHKENTFDHLPALRVLIENFEHNYKNGNLTTLLKIKFNLLIDRFEKHEEINDKFLIKEDGKKEESRK